MLTMRQSTLAIWGPGRHLLEHHACHAKQLLSSTAHTHRGDFVPCEAASASPIAVGWCLVFELVLLGGSFLWSLVHRDLVVGLELAFANL
jgi:hypothetical protein